jgi:hypothetical protein
MFNDEAGPETMVLVGRVRFEVVEWMTIDGRNLPQRAIRESTRFVSERLGATPDKPFLQRVGFIRRSFRAMTPDQVDGRVFLPPVGKPRMGVADMRQRISYSIGDNVVLVDGSLFELATPIDHIVQPEELPGLLKSAKAKD